MVVAISTPLTGRDKTASGFWHEVSMPRLSGVYRDPADRRRLFHCMVSGEVTAPTPSRSPTATTISTTRSFHNEYPSGRDGEGIRDMPGGHGGRRCLRPYILFRPALPRLSCEPSTSAALRSASVTNFVYTRSVVLPPPPCPSRPATVRRSTPELSSSVAE